MNRNNTNTNISVENDRPSLAGTTDYAPWGFFVCFINLNRAKKGRESGINYPAAEGGDGLRGREPRLTEGARKRISQFQIFKHRLRVRRVRRGRSFEVFVSSFENSSFPRLFDRLSRRIFHWKYCVLLL